MCRRQNTEYPPKPLAESTKVITGLVVLVQVKGGSPGVMRVLRGGNVIARVGLVVSIHRVSSNVENDVSDVRRRRRPCEDESTVPDEGGIGDIILLDELKRSR